MAPDPGPPPRRRRWFDAAAGGGAAAMVEAFAAFFGTAPEGWALLDAEGRLLRANPAMQRLLRSGEAPDGDTPADAGAVPTLLPAIWGAVSAARRAHAGPQPPDIRLDVAGLRLSARRLDRGPRPPLLLLRAIPPDAAAEEDAPPAAASRLETVGRLAGGIAHDFNNLLAVILGAAEAARAAPGPEERLHELEAVEDAARRGAELVRQLLAFARQQQLQPRVVGLDAAVARTAPLLRRLMGRRIALELALEAGGALVRVDPAQLDQVLFNLAANAREAMDGPQGGTFRIATSRTVVLGTEAPGAGPPGGGPPPGRYVVLEVSDTGCGIPPEVLPRLFEPFFTTRPDRGGTGLGLATIQGIVEQSGGHLAVESRVDEGTRFRIHLPRHEGAGDAPPAAARAARPGPVTGPGAAVLLVEDEAPLRRVAERLLRRAGLAVLAAESAEAALDRLAAEDVPPPAALVSDVAMPGMDGLALARALRARWPDLPVLLLSGYAEVTLGADLQAEGLCYLAKPFAPAELPERVLAMLGARHVS